ncbi:MAG: NUDIX hydrolase [Parcubacteria group bacterium GW2011_GWC1_43_30]|nr:MAG: NUDIX hydrolase [Parcubacteria group bacterium GW2011_GWC1_43_30]
MRVRLRLGVVAHIFYRGKVLLVHRDNLPHITYPDTWDSITESLEKGEDFETGMRRGLLEEIGVVPASIEMLGVTRAGHGFFFGTLTNAERRAVFLGSEGQGIGFFGLEEVRELWVGGAIGFHLAAHPEAFRKMARGMIPSLAELGLQVPVPAG